MGTKPVLLVLAGLLVVGILALASPALWKQTKQHAVNFWYQSNILCSGTVIIPYLSPGKPLSSEKKLMMTAGHCVDSTSGPFFISQGSDPETLWRVKYLDHFFAGIEEWALGDWALFEVPLSFPEAGAYICEGMPEPGEEVWAWSGPAGMAPVLRVGRYAGEIHFPGNEEDERALGGMHLVDIGALPGSSGSGVFREEEGTPCVWGILVGAFVRGQNTIVAPVPDQVKPVRKP